MYRDVASRISEYPTLINARDYKKADENEKSGNLTTAFSMFQSLGDYEDSAARAASLLTQINAAAYAEADQAEKNGYFEKAYDGFISLGTYSNSQTRAENVRQRAQYAKGMSLIADGSYKKAYSVFKELENFEDSKNKVYALGLIDFSQMQFLDATTASYKFHEKYGVINFAENKVVIPQWDEISFVSSNCLKVKTKGLYGLIDCNGNELTPCKWFDFSAANNGVLVAAVREKDEQKSSTSYQYDYFLVDTKGNTLTSAYKAIGKNEASSSSSITLAIPIFNSGLIRVQNHAGYWGFVDASGNVKIDTVYYAANDFSFDLAAVKDGRWGYINSSGERVIPCQFSTALDFNENARAEVKSGTSWHVIDKSGAIVYFEGQTFDESTADVAMDTIQKIIDVIADSFEIDPDSEDMVYLLAEMVWLSDAVKTDETEAAIEVAIETGDADTLLYAIDDPEAFLIELENLLGT